MPPARRRILTAALAIAAITFGACDSKPSWTPTPSPSAVAPTPSTPAVSASSTPSGSPVAGASLDPVYATIEEQVREIRKLDEKQPVVPTLLSREEMGKLLRDQTETDTPPALVAAYERLYHAMGVLKPDAKLTDVYGDLLESQVGGLYVPSDKKLYVVSKEGGLGPLEKFLYSHEYTHALQDQNFDLQTFQPDSLSDRSDEQMGRQALVEGDAYVTMTYWLQGHMTAAEVAQVTQQSNDPEAQAALEKIPPIISAQILFPALNGTLFVLAMQSGGGFDAVNAAFRDPPISSEQILHADKWASREKPVAVTLPDDLTARMGSGWSVGMQDTFGEHLLGVWITAEVPTGGFPSAPPAATAGWGGDRMALLDGPNGAWAVVFKTAWDTDKDAAEFEAGITPRLGEATGPARVLPGAGGKERWIVIGSSDQVLGQLAGVLGLAG